ncbi:hypothetical protein ANN_10171 [Periplaneta americana]|uniref:Uncharacterized protein n=1 Tax=Periplaneta americana TaxID=6978 RepID=A0ABQ8TQP3_PERAM|nr:hypothetical protein ANN_10171 [Periplaneta americana]
MTIMKAGKNVKLRERVGRPLKRWNDHNWWDLCEKHEHADIKEAFVNTFTSIDDDDDNDNDDDYLTNHNPRSEKLTDPRQIHVEAELPHLFRIPRIASVSLSHFEGHQDCGNCAMLGRRDRTELSEVINHKVINLVDVIGDSEMVFDEMRPRIRHSLPHIFLTVGENLGKTQPNGNFKQERIHARAQVWIGRQVPQPTELRQWQTPHDNTSTSMNAGCSSQHYGCGNI